MLYPIPIKPGFLIIIELKQTTLLVLFQAETYFKKIVSYNSSREKWELLKNDKYPIIETYIIVSSLKITGTSLGYFLRTPQKTVDLNLFLPETIKEKFFSAFDNTALKSL